MSEKESNPSEADTLSHVGPAEDQQPPKGLVGSYQIIRQMGQGGMGTVYLGARADKEFRKYVAIKVIRKGMDSEEIVARFRRERQILAALDHPNIAKLLDGGTTDEGLPYFVMEYIQGRPLTEYCDSHKLATKERLQLFRTVCSGVQFAHQNLVVHRDLKPGNILVTAEGTPKLLDFGIAKFLNPDIFSGDLPPTATEVRVMTPEYASPEQAKGDPVTTSTDIYSLGVILYELLAGRRPFSFPSRDHMAIYRAICEQEPEKPSTSLSRNQEADSSRLSILRGSTPEKLRKQLSGDLDNIILMALRKEQQRRYASAEAFSEDIRRYLEGHPVQARKATWSYRAGKYIYRHKAGVAATAAVFVSLIAFALTATFQSIRIAEQRDAAERAEKRAEAERKKAVKVTDFLVKLFQTNNPEESKGETLTARQILDRGAQRLHKEFKDQPEVQAELLDKVGNIYDNLGLFNQAESLIQESLEIRKKFYGNEDVAVADSMHDLAFLLWEKGQLDDAEKLCREAVTMHRKLLGNENRKVASDLNDLALVLTDKGQLDDAEKLFREALAIDRKVLGNEHETVAAVLGNLANVLWDKGQLDDAEKLFREALAIDRKVLGNEHETVAAVLGNLANVLWDKGQLDEAEKLYREALAIDRKLLGNENTTVAAFVNDLGGLSRSRGQVGEAEKLFREALAIDRKLLGNENPDVVRVLNNLAIILRDKGQLDEAENFSREALAIDRKLLGNESPDVTLALNTLGSILRDKGQLDEAEKLHREALAMDRKLFGNEHANVAGDLTRIAEVLLRKNNPQDAISLINQALRIPQEKMPADNLMRARAKSALGAALTTQGRYQEAEAALLDAYGILSVQEKSTANLALRRIIDLYKAWGKPEKAEQYRKIAQKQQRY